MYSVLYPGPYLVLQEGLDEVDDFIHKRRHVHNMDLLQFYRVSFLKKNKIRFRD
jgi:hypothetical protein